ncbi:Hsp20/alpha crystallin family protein [Arcicella aquatica]|uniref:Hsp20/alpha crystallin family protein n=1 Tax=Arcicella aquatica TaxID=217141 RepID=A0ABU5QTV1_9BACT|nr:Hsp20/alpha crystallin family protein [Arcicella aquatica]MEA5260533.1 Hsp20/alpha crystallin family protein [Arcicella aquatica]
MNNYKIEIPKNILADIDFSNTLNGGRVEPNIEVNLTEEAFEVFVKVAGLSADHLQMDVENNILWLYALQPVLKKAKEEEAQDFVPQTIGHIVLPNFIDLDNIVARYYNNQWKIVMPIDEHRKGFKKRIEVEI